MYMSFRFPGMCMWKEIKGKSDHKKADSSRETEMEENPRSKSAKLRIFERVL